MKAFKIRWGILGGVIISLLALSSLTLAQDRAESLLSGEELKESEKEREIGDKLRDKFFYQQRAFPSGQIPVDWQVKALQQLNKMTIMPQALSSIEQIDPIGPAPINSGFGERWSGRTNSVAIDPIDPNTVYIGAIGGGVWKSTNNGESWRSITDNAPVQATGAIAIDPTNNKIIYVGTGDSLRAFTSLAGVGVMKTTDGGETWQLLASNTFAGLGFNRLIVDPSNPNTLYAAAGFSFGGVDRSVSPAKPNASGIYKSTDGGVTWKNLLPSNKFFSGRADLVMDPSNPAILYAEQPGEGFFKTTNGGKSWKKLSKLPAGNALLIGSITICKSNPSILYASANINQGDGSFPLKLFKSTNGGKKWQSLQPVTDEFVEFIRVSPNDPNIVYTGGLFLRRSGDGGKSWRVPYRIHVDFESLVFSLSDPNKIYTTSDGGIYISLDGGNSFQDRNTNLSTTQFYNIAAHPTDPNIALGGTQDNSNLLFTGQPAWSLVFGGDGGFTAIDQTNPNTLYAFTPIAQGFRPMLGRSKNGVGGDWESLDLLNTGISPADRGIFYTPFALDPQQQTTLYYGGVRLYRSTNQGDSWMLVNSDILNAGNGNAAISTITVAPSSSQIIYVGSTDGAFFASTDGGKNFTNLTDNLPNRFLSKIIVDPLDPKTVYVSLSGFNSGHVFKSSIGGGKWQDISGNLPNVPANALILNPKDANTLFVGTDIGLFSSMDAKTWSLVPGLPKVAVFELAGNANVGIFIATHGRSIYRAKLK